MASLCCFGRTAISDCRFKLFTFSNIKSKQKLQRSFANHKRNVVAPDVSQLAAQARIAITPEEEDYGILFDCGKLFLEVENFSPKIAQIVEWFGQLEDIDLENVEPAIRADTSRLSNLRPDEPAVFKNRERMIGAIPELEEPYIKVPKILKANMEQ
eukprot:TRINITY_DN13313_c0_g1_i3.p1 TRINITY_DN13313_c0_g1~~TRINITY_DN13313_c0_g1_i3.p1  ORF type:complete len:156 (+),score=24.83 TRINITY_DN13313_c0_g1_i3:120-587(+)